MSCWDRVATYHARRPADILPLFKDLPARAAPGAEYRYGDANFILVGLVIEAVTGRAYGDVVAEEVFGPAGLHDTAIEQLDDDPRRLAVGYKVDDGPADAVEDEHVQRHRVRHARRRDDHDRPRPRPADRRDPRRAPAARPAGGGDDQPAGAQPDGSRAVRLRVRAGRGGRVGGDHRPWRRRSRHLGDAHAPPRPGITLSVVCNQDRGSWAATKRLAEAFGLNEPRE